MDTLVVVFVLSLVQIVGVFKDERGTDKENREGRGETGMEEGVSVGG